MSGFRPRSAAEIADAAIQLVRGNLGTLMPLAALLTIPYIGLQALVAGAQPLPGEVPTPGQVTRALVPQLLSTFWFLFSIGVLTSIASRAYLGEREDIEGGTRLALSRLPALLGANVLVMLVMMGAMFAAFAGAALAGAFLVFTTTGGNPQSPLAIAEIFILVVAALVWPFYLTARYSIVMPVVMLESAGPRTALTRAKQLSDGFTWRTFGLLTVSGILAAVVFVAVFALAAVLVSNTTAASALASIVFAVLIPLWASLLVVLYYDLRIRKEGYDIELMARTMGGAAAAAPASDPFMGRTGH